jgi:signal transduction histidine kinase
MKVNSGVLMGMDGESATVAKAAFLKLNPDADPVVLSNLDEACARLETDQVELLIVGDAPESEIMRALRTTDYFGLPRWAVIVVRADHSAATFAIPPRDWNVVNAERTMRHALHAAELARENARLRGDLLAWGHRVSHDLRTPLGAITTYAELAREVLADQSAADAQLVDPLVDSADELSKLIARLSFLFKASARPMPLQPVAMADVVWRVLQRQERALLQRKMTVTQLERWPEVTGVAAWLEEIWSNLIQNAVRFGTEGTPITLNWQQDDAGYTFAVHNEGEAVPAEHRPMLFQPFHSLHRPNSRKGFGLSIVQRLVELHGGRCFYEAGTTNGSTFIFTLPSNQRAGEKSSTAIPGVGAGSPG